MALTLALGALCTQAALAQDVTDPSLNGVSRSFIEANGIPASLTLSTRGFNQLGQVQILRSGFDIVNDGTTGELLLPGIRKLPGGSCAGLSDDAYFLIHVAGRPGDADGDGNFNDNSGTCSSRAPDNTVIDDGNGAGDTRLLSDGETIVIRVDRKCAGVSTGPTPGAFDLAFSLRSDATATTLAVSKDDLTGHLNQNLGGQGTAWQAGLFPAVAYTSCPATNDGYYIVRVPNWSSYFSAAGLNPGDFRWEIHAGSSNDVVQEDVIQGSVALSQPKLSITKTPDLTLCPGDQGQYTIHVSNDGNATVHGIVVTDILPAGGSIVTSNPVASGSTGTVTFPAFDLAQCESKDITVTVKASDTCLGHDVNTASAVGNFSSYCQFGNANSQPVLSGSATANFDCKAKACVTLTLNPLSPQCAGTPVTVTGKVTNCGNVPEAISVRLGINGTPVSLGTLPVGDTPFSLPVGNLTCVDGGADFHIYASAASDCPPDGADDKIVHIVCEVPQIGVTKTGPSTVSDGATIHYLITVSNPSPDVDLETVTVIDHLCPYVSNPRNFTGTCTAGVVGINGQTLSWPTFSLAKNSSCTIEFDVTANVAAGGATCPTTVTCTNVVDVFGFCAGSNGSSRKDAEASWPTTINCLVLNCPRTAGFWGAQCAQKLNGSTKYTLANLGLIASCVDSHSSFFDWGSSATQQFCRVISPSTPMDQRKQAKRQFATLLANLCASSTNNQPSKGKIILDPSTPVSCSGLTSTTIGGLISEVDGILANLEGQSLNNGSVKAQYGAIISCLDAINNGISIPVTADCEDGGTVAASADDLSPAPEAGVAAGAVELYRANPNPFNASTSFSYEVKGVDVSAVDITIYNVAGRQVRKLVAGNQAVGVHAAVWDGRNDAGSRVDRGIYFVRTSIGNTRENTMRVLYLP